MTLPADCLHPRVLWGATTGRCPECGQMIPRYESVPDAIAACRAMLAGARIVKETAAEEEPA